MARHRFDSTLSLNARLCLLSTTYRHTNRIFCVYETPAALMCRGCEEKKNRFSYVRFGLFHYAIGTFVMNHDA